MKILNETIVKLTIRIEQEDLNEALYRQIIAQFPEYSIGYKFSFPKLGPSDLLEAEYKE